MESTRQQTPAPVVAPAPTQAAPTTAYGSNAQRAARLGLAATAVGAVGAGLGAAGPLVESGYLAARDAAATGFHTAVSLVQEGKNRVAELIENLGEDARVVLDTMPLHEVAPDLVPCLPIPWVGEWLREQDVNELIGLPPALRRPLLDAALPPGTSLRGHLDGALALGVGVFGGEEVEVAREAEGLRVTLSGRLLGDVGVGSSAVLGGAESQIGVGASGQVEAGATGTVEWRLAGAMPAPATRWLFAGLRGELADPAELSAWLEALAPTKVDVGYVAGAEAAGGVDAPNLLLAGGHLAGDLLGRGEVTGGYEGEEAHARASWTSAGNARAGTGGAAAASTVTLEAWGPKDAALPTVSRVRVTTDATIDGDHLRDVVDVRSLADAVGLVEAALTEGKAAPVGTLRVEREHRIAEPEAIADLAGPALTGEADAFFAVAAAHRTARVAVVVDDALPATPGVDLTDAEQRRDQQRAVAAAVLGEVYEAPSLDLIAGNIDHASVVEASVAWEAHAAVGASASLAELVKLSGGAHGNLAVTRRVDLTDRVSPEDVQRLLSA